MKRALPVLLCVAMLCGACQTTDPTTETTSIPTTPTNPSVENFSGIVGVRGTDTKPFTVTLSGGLLTVTLLTATPSSQLNVGVGKWDGTTCALLTNGSTLASPGSTPQLSGTVAAGRYCLVVADAGGQTAAVNYTATVTHY